jgi:hypothetical protein
MVERIILSGILVCILSCSSPTVTPAAYNDALISEQIKVLKLADELQVSMDMMVPTDMIVLHEKLLKQLDESGEKVKSTESFNEDVALRNAIAHFLDVYKRLAEKEYKDAIELSSKPDSVFSQNDQARLDLLYRQIDRLSDEAIKSCKKAQEDFAKKNSMKLIKDALPG